MRSIHHTGSIAGAGASLANVGGSVGLSAEPYLIPSATSTYFTTTYTRPFCITIDRATGNLISADLTMRRIYIHDGLTNTVLTSFADPGGSYYIKDMEVDPATGNLLCLTYTGTLHVMDGISATELDSFSVAGGDGVTVLNGDLYTMNSATRVISIYDGISNTLDRTVTLDAAFGNNLSRLSTDQAGDYLVAGSNGSPPVSYHDPSDGSQVFAVFVGAVSDGGVAFTSGGQMAFLLTSMDRIHIPDMQTAYIVDGAIYPPAEPHT